MKKITKSLLSMLLLASLNSCGGDNNSHEVGLPADVTPPAITLNGSKTIHIAVNGNYAELGATATDDRDRDTPVVISQSIDSSKEGNYAVTYTATDRAGNSATIKRVVIVSGVIDYGAVGKYTAKRYPENGLENNYVVYSPEGGITADMPVAVFLEGGGSGPKIDDYRGIMEFMATKGYFVIGAESGSSYDSDYARGIVQSAIDVAVESHGLTISKLAVMGHSQGGGEAFYVMKKLQDKGYGAVGSLTLSIDGWFSFSMNKEELAELQGDVSFIQMNNLAGTGTDPRIHLSIWNIAKKTERDFYMLPNTNHSYVAGTLTDLSTNKKDLLSIIGALMHDTFSSENSGESSIGAQYKTTTTAIAAALQEKGNYSGDCAGSHYNAHNQLDLFNIDYCTPEAY